MPPKAIELHKYLVLRISAHHAKQPLAQVASNLHCLSCARLAVSGYTTTSRVPRLGFPGGHAHGQPLSWISIELVPFPVPLDLPLPLSASRGGQPRSLTRNPTLGCAGSRGLARRHDADLWQYFSTEAWLIRTPRPTGWTNCAFE
jgi:hypothetical protein